MSRPSHTAVTNQPVSLSMDLYHDDHDLPLPAYEKHVQDSNFNTHHNSEHHLPSSSWNCESFDSGSHKKCHNSRLRRLFLPAVMVLLTISALLLISCSSNFGEVVGFGEDGLFKRATNSNDGTFTSNKLYLIAIFVGLFLVLVFGIMLSAWCCRGVFENPCCCPCYLCACCGGLACLECIGCGLCAEGVEQM